MIRSLTIIAAVCLNLSAGDSALDSQFLSSPDSVVMKCSQDFPSLDCLSSLITQKDFSLAGELNCRKDGKSAADFFCFCKKSRADRKYPQALENCKKALELDPVNENIHIEIGIIYFQNANPSRALESFSAASAADPKNQTAAYFSALAQEELKNYSSAIKILKGLYQSIKTDSAKANKKKKTIKERIISLEKKNKDSEKKMMKTKAARCSEEYLRLPAYDEERLYEKGKQCLSMGLSSENFLLSHARVCLKLGKYEEARETIDSAEKKIKNSGHLIEARILSAELHIRNSNTKAAMLELKKAREAGMDNAFWLRKYSQLAEDSGDYASALDAVSSIKDKDENDISRLEYLKDKALSDEEIIRELTIRQAIQEGISFLGPYEKKLFLSMRAVERNGAAEYIRKKYMGFAGLLVESLEGKDFKYKLTLKGFNLYMRDISQKAVRFFEKKGIPLNEVFRLRTLKGENYFDKTGKLTDEGLFAYLSCLADENSKNWLRSYEEAPAASDPSDNSQEANQQIQALFSRGYMEMSEGEYTWLMHATDCPEEVLMSSPCDIKTVKTKDKIRYFICYKEGLCTNESLKLSAYVGNYRNGNTKEETKEAAHSGFFGSGPAIKRKFCYKNRIWNGRD